MSVCSLMGHSRGFYCDKNSVAYLMRLLLYYALLGRHISTGQERNRLDPRLSWLYYHKIRKMHYTFQFCVFWGK